MPANEKTSPSPLPPTVPPLIDAHVHTDDERLNPDRADAVARAERAGVIAQVVPAVSARLWPRLREACAAHGTLHACYGLHPCFTAEHDETHVAELADWIGRERPVAIGECGLDYTGRGVGQGAGKSAGKGAGKGTDAADRAFQQHLFAAQLSLAREFDLPIVIHARGAVEDVIRMIRAAGHYQGLVHSFNGSAEQARRLIDLGYSLSFGGAVTWPRATRLRELVATLPLASLLLETDAPDQVDERHAGQRNEPAWLVEVWRSVASLRDEDPVTVARRTSENAIRLFALPVELPPG